MVSFRSLASGLGKCSIWVTEKLNLKTDHHLKGDLSEMKDDKLISSRGSTVRSVSSSVTGIVVNSALAVACPMFIALAAISAIQLVVSATNCRRAQREIKRRKRETPGFKAKLKKRDVIIDVAIGATVKAAFTALGAGIVGFDNVADNFTNLAHTTGEHVVHTVVAQQAGDVVTTHALNESMGPVVQHMHDRASDLQSKHPTLTRIDYGIHKAIGGAGDKFAAGIQHLTHMQIDQATSWQTLKELIANGASKATIFAQTAIVGLVGELTQFFNQTGEIGNDEYWKGRDKKTQESRAKQSMADSQNLRRDLHGDALGSRVKQHVQINGELERSKLFKRRQRDSEIVS